MCGIAGVVGRGAHRYRSQVERMLDALEHRGPDQRGIVERADAVLGCQRLAIMDPEHGLQPVGNDREQVWAVGNGEIYGHRAVRRALGDPVLPSESDMEVVVPLWRRHGFDLPAHLPGTFALAVFDERAGRLLLARDPFGERPLYWTEPAPGLVAFASEPRALLESGLTPRVADRWVLAEVLRTGYVPTGSCVWEGMHSIPAAGLLELDLRRGRIVPRRWWQPPTRQVDLTVADAAQALAGELDRAVGEQLVADQPVGVLLSGGLDSSSVAVTAAQHHPGITAFSCEIPGDSELDWAKAVAAGAAVDLQVCHVDEARIGDDLVAASRSWGEPFGDSSALLTWHLARFVREQVSVVLTGDGADELLGGYAVWARDALRAATPAEPPRRRRAPWRRAAPAVGSPVARAYASYRSYFSPDELVALGLPPRSADEVDVSSYRWGTVEDICRFDLDAYLPGDILVKTDRASMAHGLEVRAPFLDRRLAEFCLTLPPHCKVDDHHEKLALRAAYADRLPAGLIDRRKQGFGAPMDRWLGLPDVDALVGELIRDHRSPLYELVDQAGTGPILAAGGQPAWTLLMVALWWEHHRDPSSS
jgi:asparagine synthase (glutamine-hydrolysing)